MTATLQIRDNQYIVILRWQADGKQKRKSVSTGLAVRGNKRRAEEVRDQLLSEWEAKIEQETSPCGMMFDEYLLMWLEKTKSTIAETTYAEYKNTLNKIIVPFFRELKIPLCNLKAHHIQSFYDDRLAAGRTPNTVKHYHANIHKALKYAVKQELIDTNPADKVDLPKMEKFTGSYYTSENLSQLLSLVMDTKLELPVIIASYLGLRRGEICGLKWDYIDFTRNTIEIVGVVTDKGPDSKMTCLTYLERTKTKSSQRTLPMSPELAAYLKHIQIKQAENKLLCGSEYNRSWDGFVCVDQMGNLIQPQYISWNFPKLLKKNGLPPLRFHDLRHTNATLLLQDGAAMKDVQCWLGHASMSTTADFYAHVTEEGKQKLSQSISAAVKMPIAR